MSESLTAQLPAELLADAVMCWTTLKRFKPLLHLPAFSLAEFELMLSSNGPSRLAWEIHSCLLAQLSTCSNNVTAVPTSRPNSNTWPYFLHKLIASDVNPGFDNTAEVCQQVYENFLQLVDQSAGFSSVSPIDLRELTRVSKELCDSELFCSEAQFEAGMRSSLSQDWMTEAFESCLDEMPSIYSASSRPHIKSIRDALKSLKTQEYHKMDPTDRLHIMRWMCCQLCEVPAIREEIDRAHSIIDPSILAAKEIQRARKRARKDGASSKRRNKLGKLQHELANLQLKVENTKIARVKAEIAWTDGATISGMMIDSPCHQMSKGSPCTAMANIPIEMSESVKTILENLKKNILPEGWSLDEKPRPKKEGKVHVDRYWFDGKGNRYRSIVECKRALMANEFMEQQAEAAAAAAAAEEPSAEEEEPAAEEEEPAAEEPAAEEEQPAAEESQPAAEEAQRVGGMLSSILSIEAKVTGIISTVPSKQSQITSWLPGGSKSVGSSRARVSALKTLFNKASRAELNAAMALVCFQRENQELIAKLEVQRGPFHPASACEINDDACAICNDGGELMGCDLCKRVYHAKCVGLKEVPEGEWQCPIHQCRKCESPLELYVTDWVYKAGAKKSGAHSKCVSCARAFCPQDSGPPNWAHDWWVCAACCAPEKRLSSVMNAIFGVLLSKHFEQCELFVEAVDVRIYTDYLDIVEQPMCISTMLSKNKNNEYESLSAFSQDMDLIGHNCRLFCNAKFPDIVEVSEKLMSISKQQIEKATTLLAAIEHQAEQATATSGQQDPAATPEAVTEVTCEAVTEVTSEAVTEVTSEAVIDTTAEAVIDTAPCEAQLCDWRVELAAPSNLADQSRSLPLASSNLECFWAFEGEERVFRECLQSGSFSVVENPEDELPDAALHALSQRAGRVGNCEIAPAGEDGATMELDLVSADQDQNSWVRKEMMQLGESMGFLLGQEWASNTTAIEWRKQVEQADGAEAVRELLLQFEQQLADQLLEPHLQGSTAWLQMPRKWVLKRNSWRQQVTAVANFAWLEILLLELKEGYTALLATPQQQWQVFAESYTAVVQMLPAVGQPVFYLHNEHQNAINLAEEEGEMFPEERTDSCFGPYTSSCECVIRSVSHHAHARPFQKDHAAFRRVVLEVMETDQASAKAMLAKMSKRSKGGVKQGGVKKKVVKWPKMKNVLFGLEDSCAVCYDGGELVGCDKCELYYHLECAGLESIPQGEWSCGMHECHGCGVAGSDRVGYTPLPFKCISCCHAFCENCSGTPSWAHDWWVCAACGAPEKRLSSVMNAVFGVLLSKHFEQCELFVEAVDVKIYTDYLDIVKQPMCISTMLSKIKNNEYESLSAFSQDMDLIGHNCRLFCNAKFPDIVEVSEKLMKFFRQQVEKASDVLLQIESSGYEQDVDSEAEAEDESEAKAEAEPEITNSRKCKAEIILNDVKDNDSSGAASDQNESPKGEYLCMHCGELFVTKEERSHHTCRGNDSEPDRKSKRIKVDKVERLPSLFAEATLPAATVVVQKPIVQKPIVEEVYCTGLANRNSKAPKAVRKEGTFTLTDGDAMILCHCCQEEMRPGAFELHAENRSKKAKNSVRLKRNDEQLCTVWHGRPRMVVQRSESYSLENMTSRQRRLTSQAGASNSIPKPTGKTFTVLVHNTAQAPQFIMPCARGMAGSGGVSAAPLHLASGPLRGTKIDLDAIAACAIDRRQGKLNAARHRAAVEIVVGDCVALETSDPWGEPQHRWWVARAIRPVYTVVVPFTRGENRFEVGDSVLDIKWFEIDDEDELPANKKLTFVLLPEVDTIFSYSVVSTKFPMVSEQSDGVVAHKLHRSTWQALDRAVETQNHALKMKKRKGH